MSLEPPASPKTGLIIGIPSIGWQTTLFVKHLMTMVMPLNTTVTYKFVGTRRYGDQVRPVAEADNIILYEAVREGGKYLLFLEEDVMIPALGLRQLMATMGRYSDATVVAGVVTSKSVPPEPMIYRGDGLGAYWDFKLGEVFQASSVHAGCTLIRLDDLRTIAVPQVAVDDYPDPGNRTMIPEFFRTAGAAEAEGKSYHSQDIYFCKQLAKAGKKVYVDANVNCGHFDYKNSIMFGLPGGGPPKQTDKEAVNLGCGLDWDFIDGIKPLRVDLHEVNKPDFRADLRALPPDWTERFDIVFSSHVLEHFDRYELGKVFAEIVRVCKPGGEIRLVVPSVEWAVAELVKGRMDGRVIDVIWGGRSVPAVGPYPEMYHKMGISRAVIASLSKQYQLSGRAEMFGYNQMYRLFKPPVAVEVADWLKDTDVQTFRRSFIPDAREIPVPTVDAPEPEIPKEEAAPVEQPAKNGKKGLPVPTALA